MIWKYTLFLLCLFHYLGQYQWTSKQPNDTSNIFLIDSLIASYTLDGDVLDDAGSYDGSIHGAEITANRFSSTMSAFRFDGKDEYLNLGEDFTASFDLLSVSMWLYPFTSCTASDTLDIDTANDQYFMSSGGVGASSGIYGIWNQGTLLIGQSLSDRHTSHEYHTFLEDSTWHHIVMLFDTVNEEASIYINGALSFTLDYVSGISSTDSDSLILGNANFESGNGFLGKVDDVKFYNRKLSETHINLLYKEGCPDTLNFANIHIQKDTSIYAQSWIKFDSLQIDSACNLDLITPNAFLLDSSFLKPISTLSISQMDACNQGVSIHDRHITHRGVYINGFVSTGILDDPIKEDSLLNWCLYQDFNNIYLYNIGTALSSGMQVALDSFVHKANNLSIDVTFVSAGFGTSFDNMIDYHEDYTHHPQGVVSEIEFWNGSGDYNDDYIPWLDRLDSLKFVPLLGDSIALSPEIMRRFYIGKIKNPGQPPSITIAEDLVAHHDEIFLTNYHSNGFNLSTSVSENSIRNKLSLLAQAAKNLEKEVNIVILFNVRQDSPAPNIWTYYAEANDDHDFRAGYEKFYHDFINATDIDYKQYINLKGYGIYRYSDAKVARTIVE